MLCVDHGNGQVQASLKSDRGSGAQAPPRASPIAARDRATCPIRTGTRQTVSTNFTMSRGRARPGWQFARRQQSLEHDPEKWVPVFPRDKREAFARRSCSNKKIERDDDSKKSHPALAR